MNVYRAVDGVSFAVLIVISLKIWTTEYSEKHENLTKRSFWVDAGKLAEYLALSTELTRFALSLEIWSIIVNGVLLANAGRIPALPGKK